MDKFITLCWDCQQIIGEFYRLDAYDTKTAKPEEKKKCENCGKEWGLKLCRVRSK